MEHEHDTLLELVKKALDQARALGKAEGHASGLKDAAAPLLALEADLAKEVAEAQAAVQALIAGGGEGPVHTEHPAPAPEPEPAPAPSPEEFAPAPPADEPPPAA